MAPHPQSRGSERRPLDTLALVLGLLADAVFHVSGIALVIAVYCAAPSAAVLVDDLRAARHAVTHLNPILPADADPRALLRGRRG